MEEVTGKIATRKDVRDRLTENEARMMLMKHHSPHLSEEDIEKEIRKIYDSSLEELSDEDCNGIPLFGGTPTKWYGTK